MTMINIDGLRKAVWEKPLRVLAEEHRVSLGTLKEICTEHGIKRPPPGHWNPYRNNGGLGQDNTSLETETEDNSISVTAFEETTLKEVAIKSEDIIRAQDAYFKVLDKDLKQLEDGASTPTSHTANKSRLLSDIERNGIEHSDIIKSFSFYELMGYAGRQSEYRVDQMSLIKAAEYYCTTFNTSLFKPIPLPILTRLCASNRDTMITATPLDCMRSALKQFYALHCINERVFNKKLRALYEWKKLSKGFSGLPSVTRDAGIDRSHHTIAKWMKSSRLPKNDERNETTLRRLEAYFDLKEGELVDYLRGHKGRHQYKTMQSPHSTHHSKVMRITQRVSKHLKLRMAELSQGWYPVFEQQWLEFVEFKSSPVWNKPIERDENKLWRGLRPDSYEDIRGKWFATNESGMVVPTGERIYYQLCHYFGYLTRGTTPLDLDGLGFDAEDLALAKKMYTGLGMDRNTVSLAMITDLELLGKYVKWNNSVRVSSHSMVDFLSELKAFLHAPFGYVYENKRFAHDLGLREEVWHEHCVAAMRFVKKTSVALSRSQETKHSRSPEEPIRDALFSKEPMAVLLECERNAIRAQPPKRNVNDYAIWARNLLLMRFLRFVPFRIRTLTQITIHRDQVGDNNGSLFKTGGAWHLNIPAVCFKNRSGAQHKNYGLKLHTDLYPVIEDYLAYRQYLKGPASPYLFRSRGRAGSNSNDLKALTSTSLANIYRHCTQLYSSTPAGFGPHAVRHIVATHWLKHNPRDYVTVANILQDNLETVMREYAHLEAPDAMDRYFDYASDYGAYQESVYSHETRR